MPGHGMRARDRPEHGTQGSDTMVRGTQEHGMTAHDKMVHDNLRHRILSFPPLSL